MTTQLKRFISRAGHFMKKNYHLGRREVAHRVEVKIRERVVQRYCASALEERGHIGHRALFVCSVDLDSKLLLNK